jgi:hypothetical protein
MAKLGCCCHPPGLERQDFERCHSQPLGALAVVAILIADAQPLPSKHPGANVPFFPFVGHYKSKNQIKRTNTCMNDKIYNLE